MNISFSTLFCVLSFVVCFSLSSFAQDVVIPFSGTVKVQKCDGYVTDYSKNTGFSSGASGVLVIETGVLGNVVKLTFESFNLGGYSDYLDIYKGDGVNADSLIGLYTGTSIPTDIYSSSYGKITLRFRSNSNQTGKGFKAKISCVSKVPDPDIILKSFTSTVTSVIAGYSLTASYEIFNNSNLKLQNNEIGFFVSTDTIYDSSDVFISKYAISSMNIFSTFSSSNSLLIPSQITKSGNYYILANCNYAKSVNELDTLNNIKFFPINITGSNIDLTLLNPTVSASVLAIGGTYQVKASLLNLGTTNSTSSNVIAYLSADNVVDSSDIELGKSSDYSISASSLAAITFGITINAQTKVGNYNLLLVVDTKNQVTENNELNNSNILPVKIESASIDLSIDTIKISVPKITGGNNLSVTTKFRNSGNMMSGYHTCAYYLSKDTLYDLSDKLLTTVSVPGTNQFSTQDLTSLVSIDLTILAGNYYLIAYEDNNNVIKETNENNNTQFTPFTVESIRIDLIIENASLKSNRVSKNGNLQINYTVKNNGNANASLFSNNCFISTDSILDNQDITFGSPYTMNLNSNAKLDIVSTFAIQTSVTNGAYYLIINVDNNKSISETNEKNNSIALRFVLEDAYKDIQASNMSLNKTEYVSQGIVNTFFNLENTGNQDVSYSYVGFYYSKDSVFDKSDVLITNYYQSSLMNGDNLYLNKSINLPALVEGKYYLILNADYDNSIAESNEKNNTQIIPFYIVKPVYDLAVNSLDKSLRSFTAGSTYLAKLSVSNYGNSSSYYPKVGFYISSDSLLSSDDKLMTNSTYSVTIEEGSSYAAQTTITLPSTLTSGDYYLIYKADYQNLIAELNEDNNISVQKIVIIPSNIDLFVSNITLSKNTIPLGTSLNLSCKLNNKGNASVSNTKVGYYISTDSTFSKSAVFISYAQAGLMAQNTDFTFNSLITISTLLSPGKYYLIVNADYDQAVTEINENNNYLSMPITISPAYIDLTIKKPILSATSIVKGNPFIATCDVANQGNISSNTCIIGYYLSTDTVLDNTDKLVYTYTGGTMSENASTTISPTITIQPSINAGDYYLLFEVDNLNQIIESNETNNSLYLKLKLVDPLIDLYINKVSTSTNQWVVGSSATISCNLNSESNALLNAATVSFYISKDTLFDAYDLLLVDRTENSVRPMVSIAESYTFTISSSLLPGKYYILYIADKSNSVVETNEKNNLAFLEVMIETPSVDLFVKSATISLTSVIAGNSFNLNYNLFNTGNSNSVDTEMGIYLSNDSIFDSKDLFLKSEYIYSFEPNSSYSSYDYIQIPSSTIPQNYYIIFVSDYLNKQKETNENNNVLAQKITVTSAQVDFTITNFTTSASTVNVGGSINLSCNLNNKGTSNSNTAKLAYYLSANSTYESSDILLNSRNLGNLSANSSLSDYTSVTIQSSVASGSYYVLAVADYDNSQVETNELNNVSYVQITIIKPLPDLSSSATTTVSKANSGETITLNSNAQNLGDISVSEVKMSFFLSMNSTFDNSDILIAQDTKGELVGGANQSFQITAQVPKETPTGYYFILAVVDADKLVNELNENNNVSYTTIYIVQPIILKKPDLQVANASVSLKSIEPGQGLDLSCYIANLGDTVASASSVGYYLSKDNQFDNSDVLISYTNGLILDPSESDIRSSNNVFIPKTTEIGDYYILFVADDLNEVAEISEANNVLSVPLKIVASTMSLNESVLSEVIRVYPNPTSDKFSISMPNIDDNISVELLTLKGEVLMKNNFENAALISNYEFSLEDLNQGVYMLRVKTTDREYTSRIMKVNK